MKKSKYLVGTILLLSAVALIYGCGNHEESGIDDVENSNSSEAVASLDTPYVNKTGRRICDEVISITMTGQQGATKDWQNTDQIKQIEEQFGIHIQCNPVSNDAWPTQKTLMFSSDTMPDLVVNSALSIADANIYGEQGYLLPINQYLDYMPNFIAVMEKYPDYKKAITAPDGNIYGLAKITNVEPKGPGTLNRVYVNKKWLENVGMEAPETLDEFYNVLKAFKEQDANGNGDPNDEIPLLFNENMYHFAQSTILSGFGIYSNALDYNLTLDEAGTLSIGNLTENYKEFLEFMSTLYAEGFIDQECFILTSEEVNSKAGQDLYGVIGTPSSPSITCGRESVYDYSWELIPLLTKNKGDEKIATMKVQAIDSKMGQVINANTKYPEAICRLMDFFYSDEGTLVATHGFEGTAFSYQETPNTNGERVAWLNYDKTDGKYKNSGDFRQQHAVIQSAFQTLVGYSGKIEGLLINFDDEMYRSIRSQDSQALTDAGFTGWQVMGEDYIRYSEFKFAPQVPPIVYSAEEAGEVSSLLTDVTTYFKTSKAQFITGELNVEEDWDNYVKTAESMGASRLLEIQQAAYDRSYK